MTDATPTGLDPTPHATTRASTSITDPIGDRSDASLDTGPDAHTPPPPTPRGTAAHPEIVRHAAAAFNASVTKVVRKGRPGT